MGPFDNWGAVVREPTLNNNPLSQKEYFLASLLCADEIEGVVEGREELRAVVLEGLRDHMIANNRTPLESSRKPTWRDLVELNWTLEAYRRTAPELQKIFQSPRDPYYPEYDGSWAHADILLRFKPMPAGITGWIAVEYPWSILFVKDNVAITQPSSNPIIESGPASALSKTTSESVREPTESIPSSTLLRTTSETVVSPSASLMKHIQLQEPADTPAPGATGPPKNLEQTAKSIRFELNPRAVKFMCSSAARQPFINRSSAANDRRKPPRRQSTLQESSTEEDKSAEQISGTALAIIPKQRGSASTQGSSSSAGLTEKLQIDSNNQGESEIPVHSGPAHIQEKTTTSSEKEPENVDEVKKRNEMCTEAKNCAVYIWNIPRDASHQDLLGVVKTGRVNKYSLYRASRFRRTKAAEIAFMVPEAAVNFIRQVRSDVGLTVLGKKIKAKPNFNRVAPSLTPHMSRIIEVRGRAERLCIKMILDWLSIKIQRWFLVIDQQQLFGMGGHRVVRLTFASVVGVSEIAYLNFQEFRNLDPLVADCEIQFLADPCEPPKE